MLNKISLRAIGAITLLTPAIAFAQNKKLSDIITIIIGYLNQILFLMIGVAVVFFVYNIIKYYIMADADRAAAGKYVMFSLIGFFVILSFWGLVNILQNTFGLKNETNQPSTWTSFKGIFPGSSSSGSNTTSGAASGQQWRSGAASGRPSASGAASGQNLSDESVDFDPYGEEYNPTPNSGTQFDPIGQEPRLQ